MVSVVVLFNLALAVILVFVALSTWQVRLNLAQVADNLENYARHTDVALRAALTAISNGRLAIRQVRQTNIPLELRLLRLQQLLIVFGTGLQGWQQTRLVSRSNLFKKAWAKYRYR